MPTELTATVVHYAYQFSVKKPLCNWMALKAIKERNLYKSFGKNSQLAKCLKFRCDFFCNRHGVELADKLYNP